MNDDKMASDERDPQLARLYEAAGDEAPSSALDAAILAAARREVNAGPRAGGGGGGVAPVVRQKRNWYVPMSIAAVLVLSVSLVTLVYEEKGDELAQPPMPRPPAPAKAKLAQQPAPVPGAPATVKAPASKDDSVASRNETYSTGAAPAPAPAGKIVQRKDEPKPKAAEAAAEFGALKKEAPATAALPDLAARAPASAPPPAQPEREAPRRSTATIGPRGFDEGGFASGGAAAAPRPPEADVRERRAAPSAFPAAPGAAPSDAMSRDQARSAAEEVARPAPPPAAIGSVRQDTAPRTESQRESAAKQTAPAPVESRVEDRAFAAPPQSPTEPPLGEGRAQPAPPAVVAAKPAPAPMAKPQQLMRAAPKSPARPAWLVELDLQPPERWLDKLVEFRRDGRNAEADELLAEFRKRFPDHPASAR
jgi:hypothetical protein